MYINGDCLEVAVEVADWKRQLPLVTKGRRT
jgi:hypothetical protein